MRPWLLTIKERIRRSITYLRSLPSSTRKLLSLGGILALVFALPLFVLAIVNNRFLILKRAASGEPTSTPVGSINWSTQWASFTATDYHIQTPDGTEHGRVFSVNPSKPCNPQTGEMVCVHSNAPYLNSQGLHYMTLEVTWFEYDIEMRMFIYLYSDGQRWWSNEIRVYNGQPQPNTQWVYYYGKFFDSPVGQAFTQASEFRLSAADPITQGPVTLSFSNVNFAAFLNYFHPTPPPSIWPTSTPALSPTPTANLNPPICEKSTIPPASGPAPLTVTLFGAGNAGNGTGFDGYHWDFENNGSWDTGISINPVTHTYTQAGVYQPVYQIHGTNNVWSKICIYPYQVVALIPIPTPTPSLKPTPTTRPTPSPKPINRPPVISTKAFLPGFYMRNYSALITGYDLDLNNNLQLSVRGLPSGISLNVCREMIPNNSRNEIVCTISGIPRQSGLFTVNVTLTDGAGGVAYGNLPLLIIRFPFINY